MSHPLGNGLQVISSPNRPIRYIDTDAPTSNRWSSLLIAEPDFVHTFRDLHRMLYYMPPWMTVVNKFVKIVPVSGELHELKIDKFWFVDGHKDAAVDLWEYVKWEWRDHGNVIVLAYDKANPISDVVKLPFYIPQGKVMFVVKSPVSMQKERLVYPVY